MSRSSLSGEENEDGQGNKVGNAVAAVFRTQRLVHGHDGWIYDGQGRGQVRLWHIGSHQNPSNIRNPG